MTLVERKTARRNLQWWTEDEEHAHEVVTTWFDTMRERPAASERRKQFLLYVSLYGNIPVLGFGLNSYTRNITATNRISLNVIQNGIDTLQAKVTKQRPKPTFETVKGDYEKRERAEACSDFIQGTFYARNLYEVRPYVCLDSLIFGLGSYKVHTEPGEVVYERSFPFETVIDDREAMYGKPRCRGQRKYYDKQVLIELFAREEDGLSTEERARREVIRAAIEKGGVDGDRDDVDYDDSSDQILVYEIWHLRSGPKATDGKHCICIRGVTFKLESYEDDDFPFEDVRPMRQWAGFWGIGLAEKGAGLQAEINRILRDIQAAMHLISKPHWMVPASANVVAAHLNNDLATIIKYQGVVPPTVYTPQAMSPEMFSHLQWLVRSFYEEHGISTLSAKSQKPAGLDSGIALETYLDVESERFTDLIKNDEASIKGLAEKTIRAMRRMGGNREVKTIGKGDGYRKLLWKDVDLEDDYAIRIFPTSMLPDTPAGQLNFVSTLIKGQMCDPEDAFELIEWPDTAKYAKRRGAARRVIEHNIARMKRGEDASPEPLDNHKLALKTVTEAYHEAREEGVPEERLSLFRRYLTLTDRLMRPPPPMPVPAAIPTGDMPAGPAPGMPGPGPGPGAPPAPMPPPLPPLGGTLQ